MKYEIFYNKDIISTPSEIKGHMYKELVRNEYGLPVMLKYDDRTKRNLHIYEYVGSELARTSGIPAQRTYLANRMFNDRNIQECVAVELFEDKLYNFRSFKNVISNNDISEVTKKSKYYTLHRIFNRYRESVFLDSKELWSEKLKDVILFDIVIGNSDRHSDNLGFFKSSSKLIIAPLFDNGNSFANKFNLSISDLSDTDVYEFSKTPYYSEKGNNKLTEPALVIELSYLFPGIKSDLLKMFDGVMNNKNLTKILEEVREYNSDGNFNVDYIKTYLERKHQYYKEFCNV